MISTFTGSVHKIATQRKEALSEWLKIITAQIVQCELASNEHNDQIIFSFLSGMY